MLLCLTSAMAQRNDVWENPTTEFGTNYGDGYFNIAVDVTRVELKDTETKVSVTVQQRSDYPGFRFRFNKTTYLLADGKRYPAIAADGIVFNQFRQTNTDGKLDIAFHFKPLPRDTKVFDFIEGDENGAFQVKGIRPVKERHKILFPSYWRNAKSGDWEIAFLGKHAIYDCKVWDMRVEDSTKTGKSFITLINNDKKIEVLVGKNKKGKRTITIDGKKEVCEMITGRFMPDYPSKDTRTAFVNSNYKTDTATVTGWIMNMPEHFSSIKTFSFIVNSLYDNQQTVYDAHLDSLGRFTIKIPLLNSSEVTCDWKRCFIRTMLEPSKTYFMLYDFKEGRRLWMGDDVRLQNELFKYPLDWNYISLEEKNNDFDKYIASTDSLIGTRHAYIDDLCHRNPSLSTRFNVFRKGNTTWQQAREFGQARFKFKNFRLPDNARRYAHDKFWTKMPIPYTLHRDVGQFWNDYLNDAINNHSASASFNILDYAEEIVTSADELKIINTYKKLWNNVVKAINSTAEIDKKQQIVNHFNETNADIIKHIDKILANPHVQEIARIHICRNKLAALDSLGADRFIKSVWMARMAYSELDHERKPLSPQFMDSLKIWIDNPDVFAGIEKKNEYYHALANRQLDNHILKLAKEVEGLTDGEKILKKILEPYRGKIVLIDIWGTWCAPCKVALSHSEEEYARLADYDIQYVYLASRSPKDSWENIIKEYNVTGHNIAHFNLPEEQQSAIERFLKVNAFPTYKIVDKQGNILDIKIDARDLNALGNLIKALSDEE